MPHAHHAQFTAVFTLLERAERDRRQQQTAELGLPARVRRGPGRILRRRP